MNALRRFSLPPLFSALAALMPAGGSRGDSLPPVTVGISTTFRTGDIRDAAVDGGGNFVFVANNSLRKYNPYGTEVVSQTVALAPAAVVPGAGGEIYITGKVMNGGTSDLALAKYSASGQLIWLQTAGGAENDEGFDVVLDDQGAIYAAGFSSTDTMVVKYDADGAQQWVRQFQGFNSNVVRYLAPVPGGGVTACGLASNPGAAFLTIRYDAGGTALWTSLYNLPSAQAAMAGMVRTSDGGFAVAGRSGTQPVVVKYADTGTELWAKPVPNAEDIGGVVAGPAGDAVVLTLGTKYSDDIGFPYIGDVAISRISEAGAVWSVPFGKAETFTIGASLQPGPGGGYYAAAGYSSRYHVQHARLAGMKADGSDLTIALLPTFISNMLGGPVFTEKTASGADGSFWMFFHGPFEDSLLLRRYGPPPPPALPEVVTGGFENPLPSSVVLTGNIDPKGVAVSWRFEYGPTTAYGSVTPVRQLSGAAGGSISETVTGLTPRTVYHYRLVVTSSDGTFQGEDRTVQTLDHYQVWARAMFGSFDAPGSGPLDDPDLDNTVNLIEYALGTEGNVSNRGAGLPVFQLWKSPESGIVYSSLVYRPDLTHPGVTLTPLASNDLVNWTAAGIVVRNEPGGLLRAVAGIQRFMKLKVTLQ